MNVSREEHMLQFIDKACVMRIRDACPPVKAAVRSALPVV